MELKSGYTKTEVGVIPQGWEIRPLLSAVHPATGQVSPLQEPYRSMILVAPDHIESETGRLLERRTASAQGAISGKYLFNAGDIIYSKIRPYLRKAILSNFQGLCSADMYPLTPAKDVCSAYIFAVLLGHHFSNFAVSVSARSGIPKLNREELAQYTFALPPLPEQRAIATALSDVDTFIVSQENLIAKKRDLKQAAMQQLLTGQTRLPGFSGEWEVVSLNQVVIKATGFWGAQERNDRHSRFALIIRAGDISHGGQLTATAPRFLSEAEFSKAQCRLDDLIITTSGNGLGKVWWCDGRADVAASNFVRILRPHCDKAKGRFLCYVLRSDEGQRQLNEHTATSAYPNLRPTFFADRWVHLPPLPEQTAIAAVLSDMDAELAALEGRLKKTRSLKKGMMQELLTGRTRLV